MAIALVALEFEWSRTPVQKERFALEMAARGFRKGEGRKWHAVREFKDPDAAARAVRSAARASKVSIREMAFGEFAP